MAAKVTLIRAAVALLVVTAGFAGWGLWTWMRASADDTLGFGAARDEALRAGREQVAILTTLDYHDVDAGIARWLGSSTGPLRDQLAGTDAATRESLRQAKTVATGSVLDAAVSELDQHAGTAKLLVSVEITTVKDGTAPATKRNRFAAALTHTDTGWKLSALDQIPLGGGAR